MSLRPYKALELKSECLKAIRSIALLIFYAMFTRVSGDCIQKSLNK